ncbi:LysR substrate-binding domain-containing protein [Orrella marina]|uniref:HTH lysR-type domain-containing protein n=1 Tax=Orrella marina TaxID=2163011 RepID=A0A2R4XGL5_9BURK|nr:LysR substrate-binding domain-containing protein [Orrella marina]AWB32833.1 hypothetical protein DBV39_02855 [Orrella marina]
MRLQQLRYLVTVAQTGFNISEAARLLHTSQPGVSRQLKLLEEELGMPLLLRTRNSVTGLAPGADPVMALARQIVSDVDRLRDLGRRTYRKVRKSLSVVTNHSIARYLLARPLSGFREAYPSVAIEVSQNTPDVALQQLLNQEVDLVLSTRAPVNQSQLICVPCYSLSRILIMPLDHPLSHCAVQTLDEIAKYPLVMYTAPHAGRTSVENAFRSHGIEFQIALTAADSDIVKTCVADGLGIAVITALSFDQARDTNLVGRCVNRLFEPSPVYAVARRDSADEEVLLSFINQFAPHITFSALRSLLSGGPLPEPRVIGAQRLPGT